MCCHRSIYWKAPKYFYLIFQVKYNSRAAQLYREKLHHAAAQAMRLHGTKVRQSIGIHFNIWIFVCFKNVESGGLNCLQ